MGRAGVLAVCLVVVTCSWTTLPVSAQAACDTWSHISKTIVTLGTTDRELAADFEILAMNPRESTRALIGELHPIPRKAYFPGRKTRDERHVVAVLRALHYLTGTTFSAKTNVKLSDDEKQFLDFNKEMHDENPSQEIHFFGVWMSRDADFVAPEDAQRAIIRKWKNWQQGEGKNFNGTPKKSPADAKEEWYWYG